MTKWIFNVDHGWKHQHPALMIGRREDSDSIAVVQPFTMTNFGGGQQVPDTPIIDPRHTIDFLRAALNAAWEFGLRPDGYLDTRESMKATAAHLEDMRALAFYKVGATKP